MPIRGSRGPLAAGARSRARSYSARSHTSTTPWLTMSWLELGAVLAFTHFVRLGKAAYAIPNLSSLIRLGRVSRTCSLTDSVAVSMIEVE